MTITFSIINPRTRGAGHSVSPGDVACAEEGRSGTCPAAPHSASVVSAPRSPAPAEDCPSLAAVSQVVYMTVNWLMFPLTLKKTRAVCFCGWIGQSTRIAMVRFAVRVSSFVLFSVAALTPRPNIAIVSGRGLKLTAADNFFLWPPSSKGLPFHDF